LLCLFEIGIFSSVVGRLC